MHALSPNDARPWYREPWPWLLMAGPGLVIVAGVFTAWLAFRSNDGLVADDYYKQGLAVNQVLRRDHYAVDHGMTARLLHSGLQLRLFLKAEGGVALPTDLDLKIAHPTHSGEDQSLRLKAEGAGFYSGTLQMPVNGVRHLILEDRAGAWRLLGVWRGTQAEALDLLPAGVTAADS